MISKDLIRQLPRLSMKNKTNLFRNIEYNRNNFALQGVH